MEWEVRRLGRYLPQREGERIIHKINDSMTLWNYIAKSTKIPHPFFLEHIKHHLRRVYPSCRLQARRHYPQSIHAIRQIPYDTAFLISSMDIK